MSNPRAYDWEAVIPTAAVIVRSYDTPVTLRQLFYQLVSRELLPNTDKAYKALSSRTAELRRRGSFPDLSDRTRAIHCPSYFYDPPDALTWLKAAYRRDRAEGQPVTLMIGVEKNGLVEQLRSWFGDRGLPVVALGGYASQSYVDQVARYVEANQRPAVLLYAGDFDPSGLDIPRDFAERAGVPVERVALTWKQVEQYDLPPLPGKATDSRAAAFARRHGELVQVELDALSPDTLRGLYERAIIPYWDESAFERAMEREARDLERLAEVAL